MPSLSSLALELVQEIVSYLFSRNAVHGPKTRIRRSDLHTLRLVVDPFLFSIIYIDFEFPHMVLQHQLDTLIDSTVSPSRYCRQLHIQKRSPNNELFFSSAYYGGPMCDPGDPKVGVTSAIKSLANSRVVIWQVTDDNLIEPIVDALTQLPQIEELHLNTERFNGLKGYSVSTLGALVSFSSDILDI
ncbi:hypothetical protein BYT27DRAFT_7260954 [Phlegmacium glaucopus]|nr:hypothetical protein BYT27DRAFT_7260954 [Phlegmacium glaucopus]